MSERFYTSDHHFGFKAMLRFARGRPYSDVKRMDRDFIRRWNNVVGSNDTVIYVGDFATHRPDQEKLWEVFHELKGRKMLVPGNHDLKPVLSLPWVDVYPVHNSRYGLGDFRAWLSHYPPNPAHGLDRFDICLHGHLHTDGSSPLPLFDVGVDANNFTPVPETEIIELVREHKRLHGAGVAQLRAIQERLG